MMRISLFLSFFLPVTLTACTSVRQSSVAATQPTPTVPLAVLTGTRSLITTTRYLRVRNYADWDRLWAEHNGRRFADLRDIPSMPVDFDRCEVVAIFAGATRNSHGLFVNSITRRDDGQLLMRIKGLWYQTERESDQFPLLSDIAGPPSTSPVMTTAPATTRAHVITKTPAITRADEEFRALHRVTPYGFIVLPRSEQTIVLEEDVNIVIGHPPEWKEVARLKAAPRE